MNTKYSLDNKLTEVVADMTSENFGELPVAMKTAADFQIAREQKYSVNEMSYRVVTTYPCDIRLFHFAEIKMGAVRHIFDRIELFEELKRKIFPDKLSKERSSTIIRKVLYSFH